MTRSSRGVTGLIRGAVFGMIAGAFMATFAMIAAVTYQDHGFFTPLFHISALTGSPLSMTTSMMQAASGNEFWFTPGAATVGLMLHMVTGAAFGMVFVLIAPRISRPLLVPAGALYGIAVFGFSAFIALPVAAAITGAGSSISDMASMVGYGTFALEHLVYGTTLGVLVVLGSPRIVRTAPAARVPAHS